MSSEEETDGPPAPEQPRKIAPSVSVGAIPSLRRVGSGSTGDDGVVPAASSASVPIGAGTGATSVSAASNVGGGGNAPPNALRARKMSFVAKLGGEEAVELKRTNSTNEFLKKFSRNSMSNRETSMTPLAAAGTVMRGLAKWKRKSARPRNAVGPAPIAEGSGSRTTLASVAATDAQAGLVASNPEEEEEEEEEEQGPLPPIVIPHDSTFLLNWLWIVAIFIYYNIYIIIMRISFDDINDYVAPFAALDYICDAVFVLDILVRLRTGYLEGGVMVTDPIKLRDNYIKRNRVSFILDLLALTPLDFLYFRYGFKAIFRLPRLIKSHRLGAFYFRAEAQTNYPFVWRITRIILNIMLVIHWIACFYWMLSESEGFGTNRWVYPKPVYEFANLRRKYIFSLYWATLVLTTIGDQPTPVTNYEYVFTLMTYVIGVFVFATVVGNIGNIIGNMSATQEEFKAKMDAIKQYMVYRGVEKDLQQRVKRWYDYTWQQQHILDETLLLQTLPDNLRADIALHVNLTVLKKVPIFKDCEPGFFRDLVLQLKPQTFSPGDYICRKGEIGRDMYIINHGKVEVVSDDGKTVFATLSEGSYFGEISVLSLGNNNRRTAHVRSVGFSDLFQLAKSDLHETLKDYPEAREMLAERARKLLSKDSSRQGPPAPVTLRRDPKTGKYIDQDADSTSTSPTGSRRGSIVSEPPSNEQDGPPQPMSSGSSNADLRRFAMERAQQLGGHHMASHAPIDWERQVAALIRTLPPSVTLADIVQRVCTDFTAFRPATRFVDASDSMHSLEIMSPPMERSDRSTSASSITSPPPMRMDASTATAAPPVLPRRSSGLYVPMPPLASSSSEALGDSDGSNRGSPAQRAAHPHGDSSGTAPPDAPMSEAFERSPVLPRKLPPLEVTPRAEPAIAAEHAEATPPEGKDDVGTVVVDVDEGADA